MGHGPVHLSLSTLQQPLRPRATPRRAQLIDDIAGRIVLLGSGRLRVGVDGRTAAGKTCFGHELADAVSRMGRPVLRASLDDFKKPWRERHLYDRESGEGFYRNAYDYATAINLLLVPAGPNGSGECVLCSIDPLTQIDHSSVITYAEDDAVLIVDGQFSFRPEINDFWDYRIWIDVDAETSVRRGAARNEFWAGAQAETLQRTRYVAADQIYLDEVKPAFQSSMSRKTMLATTASKASPRSSSRVRS
jgi:uridine kinase